MWRRLEIGRLVGGSLLEFGIKAYGAGAALSVALSDAETVGAKGHAALVAVPSLADEYRNAKYVVDHREEIQSAVDYLNENAPEQAELQAAADEGTETLGDIESSVDSLGRARDALTDGFPDVPEAIGHTRDALETRPDAESIRRLADIAEQTGLLVDEVQVLIPAYYRAVSPVMDNFASDEIVSTLGVMALALGLAWLVARSVGFWVRRGRPGLIALLLQRWGVRVFRPWYVRNFPWVLGDSVYEAARERAHRDLVADPEKELSPEALRELEEFFARRSGRTPPACPTRSLTGKQRLA